MSNFFTNVQDNTSQSVSEELMGPKYEYYKYIRTPMEMGMSSEGSLGALVRDASGLIDYVEMLVSGQGKGSVTGRPLGNKFFLKTGARCIDSKGKQQTRHLYINNVPTGSVPFISSGLGMDFPLFKGLLPGVLQDIDNLDPFSMFKGFMEGETPKCMPLKMSTTPGPNNQNKSVQTEYVTLSDIKEMDPCLFTHYDNKNPITGQDCREAFTGMHDFSGAHDFSRTHSSIDRDPVFQLYLLVVTLLGLYVFYQFLLKKK